MGKSVLILINLVGLLRLSGQDVDALSVGDRRDAIQKVVVASAGTTFTSIPSVVAADSMGLSSDGPLVPGTSLTAPLRTVVDGDMNTLPVFQTKLGQSRLQAKELSTLNSVPFSDQELYYAPFLFGSWNTTATLIRKVYPYGTQYAPSNSLIDGSPRNREEKVGSKTSYEVHYFSTLANDLSNRLTVSLGTGIPKSKIIADRAYNAISISKAYQQLAPIQEVEWDPSTDPTRLTLNFGAGPLAEDMRPLGPRRGEVYIRARQSESGGDGVFACSEQSRSVTIGPGAVIVSDTESITEFELVDANTIKAYNRIAAYLTPNPNSREGILWQQVGGKSVAFFDYEIDMKRVTEQLLVDGHTVEKSCVRTPKDYIQCE